MERKFRFDNKEIEHQLSSITSKRSQKTTLKKKNSPSLFARLMSIFLKDSRLVDLKSVTMCDLPAADLKISHSTIKAAVQRAIYLLIKNKASNITLLKRITNIFGLYHQIIHHVIRREILIIKLLDIVYGFMLLAFVMTFVYFVLPIAVDPNGNTSGQFLFSFNLLFLLLVVGISLTIAHLEEKLKLKIRLVLQHLVYEKLMESDVYFLDNADNNLIYRLLYSETDDYCGYLQTWHSVTPLAVLLVGVAASLPLAFSASLAALLAVLVAGVAAAWVVEWAKLGQYLKYKTVSFEQRKVFYEFVFNFKTFTLKDLKPRFALILGKLTQIRNETVYKLDVLSAIGLGRVLNWQAAILLAVSVWIGKGLSIYWTLAFFLNILIHPAKRSLKQTAAYHYHLSSRKTLDKFFDNDFLVDDQVACDDVPVGQIAFEDCDVLERDEANIDLALKALMKNEFSTQANQPKDKQNPRIASLRTQISSIVRRQRKERFSIEPSRLRLVLSQLTLTISPGQKVCIFDNKNRKAIKGFLSAIMRENYVGAGSLRVKGSVSIFNRKGAHFLVGQTIRANILYGHEFRQARYDLILKALSTSFANYRGQDLHQVGESAWNIRTDDLKNILLARFLYSESDIYIIEDLMTELHVSLMINHMARVFEYLLQGKTIIYVSNNIEALKLSDLIVSFETDASTHVLTTRQYFSYLESQRSHSKLKSFLEVGERESGHQIFASKLKNCLFVANITYEEELIIFKQLEKKRRQIEKMKAERRDVLEFISYGLYLGQRRRAEGQYLDDDMTQVRAEEAVKFLKSRLEKKKAVWIGVFLVVFCIIPKPLFLLADILGFEITNENKSDHIQTPVISLRRELAITLILLVSVALCEVRTYLARKIYLSFLSHLSVLIQDSILECDIGSILNKRSNRILDSVNKDLMQIELSLPDFLRSCFRLFPEIAFDLVMLTLLLSCWSMVIYLGCGVLFFYLMKKVKNIFNKTFPLNSFIDSKVDDLNFQLLNMIGSMRIGGLSEKLASRIATLTENFIRTRQINGIYLKTCFSILFQSVALLGMILLYFASGLIFQFPDLNFFNWKRSSLLWASLIIFRLFCSFQELPELYTNWLAIKDSSLKIVCFLLKQKKREVAGGTLRKLDYGQPIAFSKVSVTLGLTPLFKKLSFKIKMGRRVGIVGVDGGGRSVIFELITNTLKPDSTEESEISLFGLRLEELPENVIKKEVFVLEKLPALFEGSIRENIDPYGKKSDTEILEAITDLEIADVLAAEYSKHPDDSEAGSKVVFERRMSIHDQLLRVLTQKQNRTGRRKDSISHSWSRGFEGGVDFLKSGKKIPSKLLGRGLTEREPAAVNGRNEHDWLKTKYKTQGQQNNENDLKNIFSVNKQNVPFSHRELQEFTTDQIQKKLIIRSKKKKGTSNSDHHESSKTIKPDKGEGNMMAKEGANSEKGQAKAENVEDNLYSIKTLKKLGTSSKRLEASHVVHQKTPRSPLSQGVYEEEVQSVASIEREMNSRREQKAQSTSAKVSKNKSNTLQLSNDSRPDEPERYLHMAIGLASASIGSPKRQDDSKGRSSGFGRDPSSHVESKGNQHEDEEEPPPKPKMSREIFESILKQNVAFGGKNIDHNIRKLITYVRAIFSKPKILLLYEEALAFGKGIASNLQKLSSALPESTIVCITKNNLNLLFYDRVLFFDAGKILEKGDPFHLLDAEGSYLYRYLAETDRVALQLLKDQRGDVEVSRLMKKQDLLGPKFRKGEAGRESVMEMPMSSLNLQSGNDLGKEIKDIDPTKSRMLMPTDAKTKTMTGLLKDAEIMIESHADLEDQEAEQTIDWGRGLSEHPASPNKETPYKGQLDCARIVLPESKAATLMKNCKNYVQMDDPGDPMSVPSVPENKGDELEPPTPSPFQDSEMVEGQQYLRTIQEMPEHYELASASIMKGQGSLGQRSVMMSSHRRANQFQDSHEGAYTFEQPSLHLGSRDE